MPESFDLAIRGGTLVTGRGVRPATVAVRNGRVAAMPPEAIVDFGLYGGAGQENPGAIASPRARFPAAELDRATLADLDDLLRRLNLAEERTRGTGTQR